MSDESSKDTANEPSDDAQFADLADDIQVESASAARPSRLLPLLSLVLSLAAIGAAGWLWMSREPAPEPYVQDDSAVNALSATVGQMQQSVERLENRLQQISGQDSDLDAELAAIDRRMSERLNDYESLPGRMANLENTMSALQGISVGVRDTWLLAESEYYMQIANAQLQLAGNPGLARLALLQADERIAQLANPALTSIRRTLSDELRALELVDHPDIEGIALTLASLASVVESLPVRQQLELPDVDGSQASPDELSGLDRAVASLKSTMSDVVSVRRVDEDVQPFIAPESIYFLRANLALQLQAARLALLRSEQQIFQQSLDDAAQWLGAYYDADSTQVQAALQTIAEIRNSLFDMETPDISGSLKLLRQFNRLAATGAGEEQQPQDSGQEQ